MSKFLNETGLSHFWTKVKDYLKQKFVAKNENITIDDDDNFTELTLTGNSIFLGPAFGPAFALKKEVNKDLTAELGNVSINPSDISIKYSNLNLNTETKLDGSSFVLKSDNEEKIKATAIGNEGTLQVENVTIKKQGIRVGPDVFISDNALSVEAEHGNGLFQAEIVPDTMTTKVTIGKDKSITMSSDDGIVHAKAFAMNGSDDNHVLLGGGGTAQLNAAGGIAKLNDQGKLDASLVDIDTTLFEVVAALPTTGIKQNRIYLVPSEKKEDNNTYIEYIYTGDVNAAYDAAKWEKLGEYTADIDLTPYAKKENTVTGVGISSIGANCITLAVGKGDDDEEYQVIDAATTTQAGVMSAQDKKFIDIFSARYPLKISSFTASPSLLEVGGASSDINFAWGYENDDLHTPQVLQLTTLQGDTIAVRGTSYKETGVAAATTATTKTAKLTVRTSPKEGAPQTVERTVSVTYHYPSYIGVVADGATIDEAAVKALTKSVEWGKGKTAALTQANQKIVYAYPASYGDLTSIKDGNGFQGFAGYTKKAVTVNGQAYNVYVQNLPATSSSTYTFA